MGQKVDPNGLRTGVIKSWSSKWYADKAHFADNIVEDNKVRKFIKKKYYDTAISKIVLERAADKLVVAIHTARPAVLIGKAGAGVEEIKKEVEKLVSGDKKVSINIMEVKHPDADAQLVAEGIAKQLEGRASFRRAMKQAMSKAMKAGAKGVKTMVSGRLKSQEANNTAKALSLFKLSARTSITVSQPQIPRSAQSASNAGSTRVKSLAKIHLKEEINNVNA